MKDFKHTHDTFNTLRLKNTVFVSYVVTSLIRTLKFTKVKLPYEKNVVKRLLC